MPKVPTFVIIACPNYSGLALNIGRGISRLAHIYPII
jgi:hypothetical protein